MDRIDRVKVEKFLKKHRVFTEFKRELKMQNNKYLNYAAYIKAESLENTIISAFSWHYSKKRFDFWDDLNDEFQVLLR